MPKAVDRRLVALVRHADAGERETFQGDDALRPLSARGRTQADAVSRRLEEGGASVLVSSPALRCLETLSPLSARLRRAIEPRVELLEGEPPDAALKYLVERASDGGLVACSHGDVMAGVLELAFSSGAELMGTLNLEKAATAELWVSDGFVVAVSFVGPPTG